ncbi:MAG: hypothetical protein GX826_09160, partial [Gammaproteobacteria bacterium]|nr:hypothetical protein [Gammaproteobacteria bacterium]
MKFKALSLSAAVALALAACGGQSDAPASANGGSAASTAQPAVPQVNGPAIEAQVEIDQLASLPPGLTLVLKLVDITDSTNLPVVVAESSTPAPAALPLRVALPYDPAR